MAMSADTYTQLYNEGIDPGEMGLLVAKLTQAERIELRQELERRNIPVVRTLYFDYKLQVWF